MRLLVRAARVLHARTATSALARARRPRAAFFYSSAERNSADMQDMQDSDVHEGAQDSVHDQLIYRVIEPLFPDAELRKHFFNCIARGLAGDIQDKRWYMIQGPRNCGKSTFCNLLSEAFGFFVRMFGAENVLHRQSSQDAAKSQSFAAILQPTIRICRNQLKTAGPARTEAAPRAGQFCLALRRAAGHRRDTYSWSCGR